MKLRKYTDRGFKNLYKYIDVVLKLNNKAVDEFKKTNNNWRKNHNAIEQKRLEDKADGDVKREQDKATYVTKEMLQARERLIFARVLGLIVIAKFLFELYDRLSKK